MKKEMRQIISIKIEESISGVLPEYTCTQVEMVAPPIPRYNMRRSRVCEFFATDSRNELNGLAIGLFVIA